MIISLALPAISEAKAPCLSEHECIETHNWDLGVAIGWGKKTNPLQDFSDIPVFVVPTIAYYGDKFFFDNGNIGYTLTEQPYYSLNLVTSYSLDRAYFYRWDPSNVFLLRSNQAESNRAAVFNEPQEPAKTFNELEDRHFTLLGGAEAFIYLPAGYIRLAYTHDMFNVHQGAEAQIKWTQNWAISQWIVDASLVFDWKSQAVVDYYYSVRPSENAYWSKKYQAHSGWNKGIELTAQYPLSPNWDLLLAARYTQIADEIAASPLLAQDYSSTYFVGAAYRF